MINVMFKVKTPDKERRLVALCQKLGLSVGKLEQKDLNESVGSLSGLPVKPRVKNTAPLFYNMPEVIIFSGMNSQTLDKFLQAYRDDGLEPVALKAIITAHNISWTLYDLLLELQKERMEIEGK